MLRELIIKNRSYRRFDQSVPVPMELLREMVEAARLSGSARNMQPLRYMLFNEPADCARIFPTLAWAGSLKDWNGPAPGEQPTGYIVVLSSRVLDHNVAHDVGIACQTILLGAVQKGLGGCMLGAVSREKLTGILDIPEEYQIGLVIALGVPNERIELEDVEAGASTTYYRDADGTHHVPKRKLEDIILKRFS